MKTLPIALEKVGFVHREKLENGKTVAFRCGRDFFYYVLNFYYPDRYNPNNVSPVDIEEEGLFGLRLPHWLMWTMLQFYKAPQYFTKLGLVAYVNGIQFRSYFHFVYAMLIPRVSYDDALKKVEQSIDAGEAVGIDISLGSFGLIDHVMFVYGYDDEALYVFDTHQIPKLEYEKITDDERYVMKLPRDIIKKRWTRFGRVWKVQKVEPSSLFCEIK